MDESVDANMRRVSVLDDDGEVIYWVTVELCIEDNYIVEFLLEGIRIPYNEIGDFEDDISEAFYGHRTLSVNWTGQGQIIKHPHMDNLPKAMA